MILLVRIFVLYKNKRSYNPKRHYLKVFLEMLLVSTEFPDIEAQID